MDLEFTGNPLADLAVVVAALVALSLALQTAAGPTLMYMAEAVKAAFSVPEGKGGIVAIGLGVVMGTLFGGLSALLVPDTNTAAVMAAGALAGMFMGAGAVQTHKAAGEINPLPTSTVAALESAATSEHALNSDRAALESARVQQERFLNGATSPQEAFTAPYVAPDTRIRAQTLSVAPRASQGHSALEGDLDAIIAAGPNYRGEPNHSRGSEQFI